MVQERETLPKAMMEEREIMSKTVMEERETVPKDDDGRARGYA